MLKWFIDKDSRVPLYLQLKDLVRYYISTGAIQSNQRLPTVKDLSKKLAINFETIRKAYKELEKEGLITTARGRGTFVSKHPSLEPKANPARRFEPCSLDSVKNPLKRLLQRGIPIEEVKIIVEQALNELSSEALEQLVIFTECNVSQINEISNMLRNYLSLKVEPVLLRDLRREVEKALKRDGELLAILTTGFHMNEVRNALADLSVRIDFLVTNMSLETRRQLAALDKTTRYGFICRDRESIAFYKDMLREELGLNSNIECCILEEESRVKDLLASAGVLLVSPPVYEDVKRLAPATLPVFNVFNRVDPMSLMIIKESLLGTPEAIR